MDCNRRSDWIFGLLFGLAFLAEAEAAILRVATDADPANNANGGSWAQATNLQRALALASGGDEIWVRSGVYFPDEGQAAIDDDPSAHFALPDGVEVFGGFAGTELVLAERDLGSVPASVLSGDLQQDDADADGNAIAELAEQIAGVNSHQIVAGPPAGFGVLDGFVITGGDARLGGIDNHRGAALRTSLGPLIVRDCQFLGNAAIQGGAVLTGRSSVSRFVRCRFSGNAADHDGGAVYCDKLSADEFTSCRFVSNSVSFRGAAVYADFSSPVFTNCFVTRNTGSSALDVGSIEGLVRNCTVVENTGLGIYCGIGRVDIVNSISWGNDTRANTRSSTLFYSHSIVEDSFVGDAWDAGVGNDMGGNSAADPQLLAGAAGELMAASPAIDAGDAAALPDDLDDLDGDGDLAEILPLGPVGSSPRGRRALGHRRDGTV